MPALSGSLSWVVMHAPPLPMAKWKSPVRMNGTWRDPDAPVTSLVLSPASSKAPIAWGT